MLNLMTNNYQLTTTSLPSSLICHFPFSSGKNTLPIKENHRTQPWVNAIIFLLYFTGPFESPFNHLLMAFADQ